MTTIPTPIRMTPHLIEKLDSLVADMREADRVEVDMVGNQWGRAALIRLLLSRGVEQIRREIGLERDAT